MMRKKTIVAALAVLFSGVDKVASFTVPVSRAIVGTNVRLESKSKYQTTSSSPLYMSAEVAAKEEESGGPLFEGLGKGILRDCKNRLPFYKSDITDGLNVQVSALFFCVKKTK